MEVLNRFSEQFLLRRINKGNPEAFARAYDLYAPKIFRHIYFRINSKEDAEDLTSQAFLKTWKYLIEPQNKIRDLKNFLYKTAQNLVIDYYRRKDKLPINIDETFEKKLSYESDIVQGLNSKEEFEAVRNGIAGLKKDFRDIIVLRYIDGLSLEEISKITQKSKNAVYISISRAIKDLKKNLKVFYDDQ